MRGKGVPKNSLCLVFFWCVWVSEWSLKMIPIFFIFVVVHFGSLFVGFLDFLGALLGVIFGFLRLS